MIWQYITAFAVGGAICVVAQILIDKTSVTPARILVGCVGIGVLLVAVGAADSVKAAVGAGITTPIIGYGIALANGVKEAVAQHGALGVLSGGLTSCSAGVSAVILFAFLAAIFSKPKAK